MKTITATYLTRNLGRVLDRLVSEGEGVVIKETANRLLACFRARRDKLRWKPWRTSIEPSPTMPPRRGKPIAARGGGREAGSIKAFAIHGVLARLLDLAHARRLLTRNKHDFEGIPGRRLVTYRLAKYKP